MKTWFVVAILIIAVWLVPAEGKIFMTLAFGDGHISWAVAGPDGGKSPARLWEVGFEGGYSCRYFSLGATYKMLKQDETKVPDWAQSYALDGASGSVVGLRLGTGVFTKGLQFRILLAVEQNTLNMYYPGFEEPVVARSTLAGPELDLNINFTSPEWGKDKNKYQQSGDRSQPGNKKPEAKPLFDFGIGFKMGVQRPVNAFFKLTQDPTYIYGGFFIRIGLF